MALLEFTDPVDGYRIEFEVISKRNPAKIGDVIYFSTEEFYGGLSSVIQGHLTISDTRKLMEALGDALTELEEEDA